MMFVSTQVFPNNKYQFQYSPDIQVSSIVASPTLAMMSCGGKSTNTNNKLCMLTTAQR